MNRYEIDKYGYFQSFDNLDIRYGYFGNLDHERVLMLFPGRAEYIEKYFHIIDFFVKKKYMVFMMDWRGQGGSGRELQDSDKGYVEDFLDYQKDLKYFIDEIVIPLANKEKIDVIAHSMGGHNLLRYIIENQDENLNKIIFSSPMLGIDTSPLPNFLARVITKISMKTGLKESYLPGTGKFKRSEFKDNKLTSDYEMFFDSIEFLEKNRKLAIGGPVFSWLYNAFESMDFIEKNLSKIDNKVKTKVIYGADDKVVDNFKIMKAKDYLTHGGIEIKDARHELMMERNDLLNQFLNLTIEFLDE